MRKREKLRREIIATLYDDIWTRAVKRIGGSIQTVYGGYSKITLNNRVTYVHQSSVCLDNHLSLRMAGNKVLIYKLLEENQLIKPPSYCAFSIDDVSPALIFFRKSAEAVVVKPATGTGAGAGVISNVSTVRMLIKAIIQAGSFCNELLIEEQIAGKSYRLLYLGGNLIDAVERRSPAIVGNGKDSILKLVQIENELRETSRGRRATGPVDVDLEMMNYLEIQSKSLGAVLAPNERVDLKHVVNQNNVTENKRVLALVHPTFRDLGKKLVNSLSLDLAGVDLIVPDISSAVDKQVFAMNDINTKPGLHHHYLLSGDHSSPDIAAQILKYIFDNQG